MITDFRALCAELIASWDADGCDWKPQHQARWEATVARARAALGKDEPAVPEDREPVAVTGQPSDEDLLELAAAEMNSSPNWEEPEYSYEAGNPFPYEAPGVAWVNFARAVLARWGNPAPVPPADGEVAELVAWLREIGDTIQPSHLAEHQRYKRAAELLERQAAPACVVLKPSPELIETFKDALPGRIEPLLEECHPTPVPVAERLPGPEVCVPHPRTKRGNWCWGFERCEVSLARPARWRLMHMETVEMEASHWLPAHALPIPHQQENAND